MPSKAIIPPQQRIDVAGFGSPWCSEISEKSPVSPFQERKRSTVTYMIHPQQYIQLKTLEAQRFTKKRDKYSTSDNGTPPAVTNSSLN